MSQDHQLLFPPFRLDPANERLWRGEQPVPLRPKALAVLRYLAERAQRLVTQEELLQAVWQRSFVSEGLLRGYIRELREVLGDDAKVPRFIETANRRGYRFIAPVTSSHPPLPAPEGDGPAPLPPAAEPPWVGRAAELARLQGHFERARSGTRQVVLVSGGAGIGKTTLVNGFLAELRGGREPWVLEGQCVESYGAGEALMPVLEALTRAGRGPMGERLMAALRRYAPTWLLQLPWLVDPEERESLHRQVLGATQQRLLSEFCELLEVLSAEQPLVLVLEDLHWSDPATLDLLSVVACRRTRASLLVIGTYRPLEIILHDHPLRAMKQNLRIHRLIAHLALELLTPPQVADYLARRFPDGGLTENLPDWVYRRTEGHPLFMVNLVDYLIDRERLARLEGTWEFRGGLAALEREVPESLKQMIEQQIAQLNPEHQRLLEVASLAGMEFSAALLAAVLGESLVETEGLCSELARRGQFLRSADTAEWPDGTFAARFAFLHAFYPEVLQGNLPPARRVQWHLGLGECLETAYGARAGEIAPELALHFETGRDAVRAVGYLRRAAEASTRRHAHREAVGYLDRALALVARLPAGDQAPVRLGLLEQRGLVRRAMDDMTGAVADFEALVAGARQQGSTEAEVVGMIHLNQALFWFDRERSLEIAALALERSRGLRDRGLRAHAEANHAAWTLELRGWRDDEFHRFNKAREAINQSGPVDLRCEYTMHHTYLLFHRSRYAESYRSAVEGMQLALEKGDAYQYFSCQLFASVAQLRRGGWGHTRRLAQEGLKLSEANGLVYGSKFCHLTLAWLHLEAFDFEPARRFACLGLEQARQNPYDNFATFLGLILLGRAYLGLGQPGRVREYLEEIRQRAEGKPRELDWLLKMPLYQLQAEYWQSVGCPDRTAEAAGRLCDLAGPPGGRTFLAHGYRLLAEIALAGADLARAEADLARALAALEDTETPLAAWRVHATAAELHDRQGRAAEAEVCRDRGAAVIHALADSLDAADPLRRSLLAAAPVRTILGGMSAVA